MREEKFCWPGVGHVSEDAYAERVAAAKRLCGTEGQPPHRWQPPVVGDTVLVCGYCGKEGELLDPTTSRQVDELLYYLDDDDAAQLVQSYRAAVDAQRAKSRPLD